MDAYKKMHPRDSGQIVTIYGAIVFAIFNDYFVEFIQ